MFRPPLFSNSDRRALLAVTIVLTLLVGGAWWWSARHKGSRPAAVSVDSAEQVNRFWTDVQQADSMRLQKSRSAPQLFAFDPNRADSATMVSLGLPRYVAGRICRYRKAGGRFRWTEDLRKIYGLSEADYRRLEPYVHIASPAAGVSAATAGRDTSERHRSEKFSRPVQVDLNTADSLTLIRIPGIGPYFAHRIRRYGNLLGGYVDVAQLSEIRGFPADALQWFSAGSGHVRKLNVNTATFKELLRHPYLNYEQVKAIVNHRRKQGALRSLQELSNNEAFSAADLKRLAPYVDF
jgi:DNA uptake protein ComE-like DNA-binding protein